MHGRSPSRSGCARSQGRSSNPPLTRRDRRPIFFEGTCPRVFVYAAGDFCSDALVPTGECSCDGGVAGRVVARPRPHGRRGVMRRRANNRVPTPTRGRCRLRHRIDNQRSPQVKELNLFALPFLFPSYSALDAVEAGDPGKRIFQLIEQKGVIPIAWGENGFRELTNSKRPIRRPEKLAHQIYLRARYFSSRGIKTAELVEDGVPAERV